MCQAEQGVYQYTYQYSGIFDKDTSNWVGALTIG